MPEITDEEKAEFDRLKHLYNREKIWASATASDRLQDDIDEPIKRCVMALALLGCEPQWSCCGFDYHGQPLHKSHQYGRCYFILGNRPNAVALFNALLASDMPFKSRWCLQSSVNGNYGVDLHADGQNIIEQWDTKDSIHDYETLAFCIQHLDMFLMELHESFLDEVTLIDTNVHYGNRVQSWQYPPKREWVIRKSDLLKEMECQVTSATYAEVR